jgi:hypothetical protein
MNARRLMAQTLFVLFAAASAIGAKEVNQPVALFNGKDLSGWSKRGGEAAYTIENDAIVGRSKPDTSNTFLATDQEYGDFELELDFKIDDPKFNSGVQIRSHARPQGNGERVYGYQVEIDPRPDRGWTGGIYYEAGSKAREAGWLNDLSKNDAARNAFKLGEWNHLRIVAQGRRVQTWINGVPAADFTETNDAAYSPQGFIALQVHSVGSEKEPKEVRWRNIRLTNLNDAAAAADAYGP